MMDTWIKPPPSIQRVEELPNWLESLPEKQVSYLDLSHIIADAADLQRGLAVLCSAPTLMRLRGLSLRYWRVGSDGARMLAESPYLRNLVTLDLEVGEIGVMGATYLANARFLTKLQDLNISHNYIGTDGIEILLTAPFIPNLVRLNVIANDLKDDGILAVAGAERLTSLNALYIGMNSTYKVTATQSLFRSPVVRKLNVLHFSGGALGRDAVVGTRALTRSACFPMLEELYLNECGISGQAARILFASESLPNLRCLDLTVNGLGSDGVAALASCAFPALLELYLHRNDMGDNGLHMLALQSEMPSLQELGVGENSITDEGASVFAGNHRLSALRTLYLWKREVSEKVIAAIRSTHPDLTVTT